MVNVYINNIDHIDRLDEVWWYKNKIVLRINSNYTRMHAFILRDNTLLSIGDLLKALLHICFFLSNIILSGYNHNNDSKLVRTTN